MDIGIKSISKYIPKNKIDNQAQAEKLGASSEFILNKIGNIHLSRKLPNEETTDIAQKAVEKLFGKYKKLRKKIKCLIVITQNPDGQGLPHSSAILHQKLGLLEDCAVFDISLGCSGFVQGVSIAKGFMETQGFSDGLLVTADPYSKIINLDDRDTALLFGDGATATWLGEKPLWSVVSNDFGIISSKNQALCVEDGKLKMHGREVFNFAATNVPSSIKRVLAKAKLNMDDIDQVFLHQGSRFIVESIAKRIGAQNKTPFAAMNYGNTVSSSIPIMLADLDHSKVKLILLSGFGVGLSWATCILKRNNI